MPPFALRCCPSLPPEASLCSRREYVQSLKIPFSPTGVGVPHADGEAIRPPPRSRHPSLRTPISGCPLSANRRHGPTAPLPGQSANQPTKTPRQTTTRPCRSNARAPPQAVRTSRRSGGPGALGLGTSRRPSRAPARLVSLMGTLFRLRVDHDRNGCGLVNGMVGLAPDVPKEDRGEITACAWPGNSATRPGNRDNKQAARRHGRVDGPS